MATNRQADDRTDREDRELSRRFPSLRPTISLVRLAQCVDAIAAGIHKRYVERDGQPVDGRAKLRGS